jgi:ABC-type Fe3+ transport system permease subunit
MTRLTRLSRWHTALSTHLPHLSKPQLTVLAFYTIAIILAHSCGLTTVATILAYLLARSEYATREQLRD